MVVVFLRVEGFIADFAGRFLVAVRVRMMLECERGHEGFRAYPALERFIGVRTGVFLQIAGSPEALFADAAFKRQIIAI